MMMFRVMPYLIHGVTLYAVEREDGYIEKYCNTRGDAQDYVDSINSI